MRPSDQPGKRQGKTLQQSFWIETTTEARNIIAGGVGKHDLTPHSKDNSFQARSKLTETKR